MAAANITLKCNVATIESDATPHKVTLGNAQRAGGIINQGPNPVYVRFDDAPFVATGLQEDGEVCLQADDSAPVPGNSSFFRHRCAAGLTSILMYTANHN